MDTEPKPAPPTLENIESGKATFILPPKNKRVPPRFTSKEQIIARIDKFTRKAKRYRSEQTKAYQDARDLREIAHRNEKNPSPMVIPGTLIKQATSLDAFGDKRGRQADRLEKDVLSKLSRKLAEFQTETIPGFMDDRSIPGL